MVPTLDFADLDTDVLKSLDVPSLVLWGAKDRWISPAHVAQFAQRIRGTQSVMYEGLGHIPMEEDPGRVLEDLRVFLAKKTVSRKTVKA
jgi:pimeloyl-ACP methyl ester carboxylesterase